jgi:hypothetical protein
MSELEEQITKINKLIQEKTTELNALQGNLRKMPYQNRIKSHNLKKQKLLSNQIKSLTQNLNTLQNLQGEIVKQQRITNSLNRNVPSDKDVNVNSPEKTDEELLKELEEADEAEEKMGQPVKEEVKPVKEEVKPVKEEVKPVKEEVKPVKEEVKPVKEEVKPVKEEKPVEEEQKVQLPGKTIPTPDENYIKRPSTEEEEGTEGQIDDEYIKIPEEEERGVKPVKEERGVKPVKVPKYKQGKFVLENQSQNPTPEDEEDLYSNKKPQKNDEPLPSRNIPVNAGFSETIVPNQNVSTGLGPKRPNMKLCPQIFDIGKKVNNKFFIPSQFPNLTKKKSLLKGGRKHMKTKGRSRRSNRINISRKGISRKGLIRNKRKSVKNLALYSKLNRHKLM